MGSRWRIDIPNPWGGHCWYTPQTTSTMHDALELEEAGEPDGSLILAGSQTAGRGRFTNRRWDSAPNQNLLMTFFCQPMRSTAPNWAPSLLIGLGVCRWLEALLIDPNNRIQIKWPNDIYLNHKKIAGILVQSKLTNHNVGRWHIGIGLNLLQTDFPSELQDKVTSLACLQPAPAPQEALATLLPYLKTSLHEANPQAECQTRLWQYQQPYQLVVGNQMHHGQLVGLTENGWLQLETEQGLQTFSMGE